jgi:hypothetical protein
MTISPSLCISIDVECDMPNWIVEPETTVENIAGIPRLQAMFDDLGVKPTYLVTYPVASSPACIDIFRPLLESGRCEIGMHCHPWTTPPVAESERLVASFLSAMSDDAVAAKLRALTVRITESFGVAPVSYRAGRFGLAARHLWFLEELGYLVETSVTPLVDWRQQGGPDYRDAPLRPYRPNYLDVTREGNSRLLEVPVTIVLTRPVPDWVRRLYVRIPSFTKIRGLLSRDRLDVLDVVWAYAAEFTEVDMLRACDSAVAQGAPLVNFFMHSNEVWPGASPYCRSEDDLEKYLARLRRVLEELVVRRGLVPRTLKEFHAHAHDA